MGHRLGLDLDQAGHNLDADGVPDIVISLN